jgi:tetratricopeptide (TPR) repeat protein
MNSAPADKKLKEARQCLQEYNFAQAIPAYEKLTHYLPRNASVWFEYGCAASGTGQLALVDRAWSKAVELEPNDSEFLVKIGRHYQDLHLMEKARGLFERAAAADPRGLNPRIALAKLLEKNHQIPQAREVVGACLAMDARDEQARYVAALLDRRENKLEAAERGLRDLMAAGPRHPAVLVDSHYLLAEVLDRTQRFDEAMEILAEGKKLVRGTADIPLMLKQYDQFQAKYRNTTLTLPANILRSWAREFPPKSRAAIPRLAFLGGHPRSGTTLLEQILGAHPEVAALDEPKAFSLIAVRMFNASPQLSPARLNLIRRHYVEALQNELGAGAEDKLILDKNPMDIMKLCIWLRFLPELRVIMALRDPRDVVISCYFQNIPLNAFSANFLFLERTAIHYANMLDIWLAARQWEGFHWIETRYEDIVADLALEGRRVTEFLGLSWRPEQANYHEKSVKQEIFAPTYHDARQPIYARAVSRWRAYEKHLAASLPMLEPYGRAFGYS